LTSRQAFSPHTHDFTGTLHIGEGGAAGIGTTVRHTTLQDRVDVWKNDGGAAGNNASAIFDTNPADGSPRIMGRTVDASHVLRMYVKESADPAPELEYASNATNNDIARPEQY